MRIPRILLVVLAIGVCGVGGNAAAADDSARADPEAEELLKQGIALRRSGNDEAALAVFLDLEKLTPDSVRVLLHICTAAQATGKWIMAYNYLQKAETHREDPYFQRHKAAIETVEAAIAQRVGQFRVRGSPAGAEVRLSGQLIGTLPMMNLRPVEVGTYVLEVSKPGYYVARRPITIAAGGGLTQEAVDLREQTAAPAFAGGAPTAATLQAVPADAGPPPSPPAWWRGRWITWTLAGVGIAAGATSVVAFGIREGDAARWNDDTQCLNAAVPTETRAQRCMGVHNDIVTAEDVGIAAGITAVAFGGAALIHGLVTAHDHAADSSARAARARTAQAYCTPGLGTVVCAGTF